MYYRILIPLNSIKYLKLGKFRNLTKPIMWATMSQSVKRLANGWKVQGSHTDGSDVFRNCAHRPWDQPGLLYDGYRVNLRGKASRTWL